MHFFFCYGSDAFEYISGYKIDFINTRKIVEGANLVGFGCKRATLVFRFLLEMVNNVLMLMLKYLNKSSISPLCYYR